MAGKSARPTVLIMVGNMQTHELKVISACRTDREADAVFDHLAALFRGTHNVVHKVPIPSAPGFAEVEIVSAGEPPEAVPPMNRPATGQAEIMPFRRVSQSQFELETQSMIETGSADIPIRDADEPISEGGAFSS